MRFQLRLVAALWLASLVVIGIFAYLQVAEEKQRLTAELDRRAVLLSEGLKEVLEPALARGGSKAQVDRIVKKFSKPDQGLAVYDRVASLIVATPDAAKLVENPPPEVTWALTSGVVQTGFRRMEGKTLYVYADPIIRDERAAGALTVAALLLASADASAQIYTRRKSNGVIEATNVPSARDFRLTYPGKGRLIHSFGFRGSYAGQYDKHVEEAAAHHGVSPALVKAVIQVESEWDALAVSSKGARGLMQLMPFTAERFGEVFAPLIK